MVKVARAFVAAAASAAASSDNPGALLSVLFPASASATAQIYALGILQYPGFYTADGTKDALDPVGNDRQLAGLIEGAQLALYPGAGHGFWFQDESGFVTRVEAFLG